MSVNQDDPYRTPANLSGPVGPPRPKDTLFFATLIWLASAALLLGVSLFVRPVFAEFEVALPVLSQWVIHPLASVMCFAVAASVLVVGLSIKDPSYRRLAGAIWLLLGLVTLAAVLLGAITPLISLIGALS